MFGIQHNVGTVKKVVELIEKPGENEPVEVQLSDKPEGKEASSTRSEESSSGDELPLSRRFLMKKKVAENQAKCAEKMKLKHDKKRNKKTVEFSEGIQTLI